MTRERLAAWLKALPDLAPMSRHSLADGALRVLRAAAPDGDWQAQIRLVTRLRGIAGRGTQQRKVGRILSSARLLEVGLRHAGPDAEAAPDPLETARRRRDGVMVALLAAMPMRKRAFCELALGDSLITLDDTLIVVLRPEMTKNHQYWEAPVPEPVASALQRYIGETRPFLMARTGQTHDSLWVGEHGQPIRYRSMEEKIGSITERLLGVRVPPHFFRDAAATTLARMSPEQALLIRPLLGHSSFRTADRHYIQAEGIEAARTYGAVIERLKRGKR